MAVAAQASAADLDALVRAARAGGEVLREWFHKREQLEIRSKGPANFVSDADLAAEAAIRTVLRAHDPDASWLGEETGADAGKSARSFVVDPLDGTTNFLCGIPHFSVSIALREGGQTLAGVVYQPLIDELFAAARGAGATRNGAPMCVSSRVGLEHVVIATGIPHSGSAHHLSFARELACLRDRVAGVRRFGSAALDLAWVAAGRFDGFWERGLQPWDVAAGNLLVREAGGRVGGIEPIDDPDSGASVVAATPWLHDQLVHEFALASGRVSKLPV
jgi:myo-inositol-1(or 4)-monophosphatase